MNTQDAPGSLGSPEQAEGNPAAPRRSGRWFADEAVSWLRRHCDRMRTDVGYREAVDDAIEGLSKRRGPVGKAMRLLAPGHAFVVKVL